MSEWRPTPRWPDGTPMVTGNYDADLLRDPEADISYSEGVRILRTLPKDLLPPLPPVRDPGPGAGERPKVGGYTGGTPAHKVRPPPRGIAAADYAPPLFEEEDIDRADDLLRSDPPPHRPRPEAIRWLGLD